MSKITVTTAPKNRISINNRQRGTVKTISVGGMGGGGSAIDRITELTDVDASDVDNNETLVYDEVSGKFVIKELPIINGGTF